MRCFYLFKINNEFSILSKDNPYKLYEMFDMIDFVDENANGIPDSEENGDYGPSTILDWTGAGD